MFYQNYQENQIIQPSLKIDKIIRLKISQPDNFIRNLFFLLFWRRRFGGRVPPKPGSSKTQKWKAIGGLAYFVAHWYFLYHAGAFLLRKEVKRAGFSAFGRDRPSV